MMLYTVGRGGGYAFEGFCGGALIKGSWWPAGERFFPFRRQNESVRYFHLKNGRSAKSYSFSKLVSPRYGISKKKLTLLRMPPRTFRQEELLPSILMCDQLPCGDRFPCCCTNTQQRHGRYYVHVQCTVGCSDFYLFFIYMAFHPLVVRLGPHELKKCF